MLMFFSFLSCLADTYKVELDDPKPQPYKDNSIIEIHSENAELNKEFI